MATQHSANMVLPVEAIRLPQHEIERLALQALEARLAGTGQRVTKVAVPGTYYPVEGSDHQGLWQVTYWSEPIEPESP